MQKDEENKDEISFDEDNEELEGEALSDKLKRLRRELRECTKEKGEYLAGWQRAKADYVNLKKSTEEEKKDVIKYAKEDLLINLIQLADSFEMAFANKAAWESAPENWRKGVEYIYAQLESIFSTHGLEEINPLGDKFDPNLHHSVGTIECDDCNMDKVLEVVKNGYILNGKVVRAAQVKVGVKN